MLCWRQHWATPSQAVEPGGLGKENKAAGPGELGLGSFCHMGPEEVALTEVENGAGGGMGGLGRTYWTRRGL